MLPSSTRASVSLDAHIGGVDRANGLARVDQGYRDGRGVATVLAFGYALYPVGADQSFQAGRIIEGDGVASTASLPALPSQSGLDRVRKLSRETASVVAAFACSYLDDLHGSAPGVQNWKMVPRTGVEPAFSD